MHLQEFWELWVLFRCCTQQLNKISWCREFLSPRLLRFDQFTFFCYCWCLLNSRTFFFAGRLMVVFPLSYYVFEGWTGEIVGPNKNMAWIGKGYKLLLLGPEWGASLASWFVWCPGESLTPIQPQSQDLSLLSRSCLFYSSRTEPTAV